MSHKPAYKLVAPIVNHLNCQCSWGWFQSLAKIIMELTKLSRIAPVDIQPAALFVLPGKQTLIIKASKGSNTDAKASSIIKDS